MQYSNGVLQDTGHSFDPQVSYKTQKGGNMDKALLESKMVLYGDTRKTLASYLGISERSLISKINESGTEFRQGEIAAIKMRYDLSEEEVVNIFFN